MSCNNCQNSYNNSYCGCSRNDSQSSCSRSQREMLNEIMALNFAINDLALYLDTHPDDQNAIRMHCEYSERQISLTAEYQRLYGPLTINFMSDTWDWIDEPWPWERGAY